MPCRPPNLNVIWNYLLIYIMLMFTRPSILSASFGYNIIWRHARQTDVTAKTYWDDNCIKNNHSKRLIRFGSYITLPWRLLYLLQYINWISNNYLNNISSYHEPTTQLLSSSSGLLSFSTNLNKHVYLLHLV